MSISSISTSWIWCLAPSHMTCVFVGFSRSLLARILYPVLNFNKTGFESVDGDGDMSDSGSGVNLAVVSVLMQLKAVTRDDLSSAVYRTYSSGPSTEPCGTPNSIARIGDRRPA
jgi:hypothetical protein